MSNPVELVGLGFTVSDARTGQRLQATVHIDGGSDLNFTGGTEGPEGDLGFCFANVGRGSGSITLSKQGYITRTIQRDFPGETNVNYTLESAAAPRPTRDEMFAVRANFCNIWYKGNLDAPIFTALMGKYDEEGITDEVLAELVAAGSTHVTLSPEASYPGQGGFNWLDQPDRFAHLVLRIADTAGANGKGLTPILFLDNGSRDPLPRINQYWPGIAASLRKLGIIDRCIVVPAWEPVKGDWTSAELSAALKLMKSLFPEAIQGWHGSPTRWVGSSNPVEPDDPWQGAESGFYKSNGGEFIEIVFYQAQAESVFQGACDPNDDNCWLNRWTDGVERVGAGKNGWRIIPICLAEGPAYYFIRGQATSEQARQWATAGKNQAAAYGVIVSYMNGLPY